MASGAAQGAYSSLNKNKGENKTIIKKKIVIPVVDQ